MEVKNSVSSHCAIIESIEDIVGLTNLLKVPEIELIKIPQPDKDNLLFKDIVDFLLAIDNFNWVFKGSVGEIVSKLEEKLLPIAKDNGLEIQAVQMIESYHLIMNNVCKIFHGTYQFGLRNFFCPGDTFFHLDNASKGVGLRFLWAIGRPYGMRYTPYANIKLAEYWNFIRRELYLIRKMDMEVYKKGLSIVESWPHRPSEIKMMKNGWQYYLIDSKEIYSIEPNWSSIHFLDTPDSKGTFHCNTFLNEFNPGLQLLFTAYQS